MARGKREAEWAHTSEILALIAEVNRDRKARSKQYTSADFNPFAKRRRKPKPPVAPITVLRDVFVKNARKEQKK